jgi:putative ABC transport system ATP-binding protein
MNISTPLLKLSNVCFKIKTKDKLLTILNNINLSIERGTSLAITGPSGSGKTSLLSIMAGLQLPTTGKVWYQGQNIVQLDESHRARLRAQKVGFIFQSFELLPNLTALENIQLPLEVHGRKNLGIAIDWLSKVGLKHRTNHYPGELSGGEQQRVAIARAFITDPQVIFADEPTGSLDKQTAGEIIDLLFKANKEQETTLIMVTHDENLASYCQKNIPLTNGQLECLNINH